MRRITAAVLASILLLAVFGCAAAESVEGTPVSFAPFFMRVSALFHAKEQWTCTESGEGGASDTIRSSEWLVFGDDSGAVYMKKAGSNDTYRVFIVPDWRDPTGSTIRLALYFIGRDGTLMIFKGMYE